MPPIVLDGTTGITTPGLTNTGTETLVNLTTTGNTTLGDATTDTLTVGVTGIVKDASGNVGIGTASVATNFRTQFVGTAGSNTSAASSGTTQAASAVLRLQAGGGFTGTLDIGQGGGTGSWLQSCDTTNLATTYSLLLNPVGGNVGIGTSSPNATLHLGAGGATFRIGITASNQYGELYRDGATGNIVLNAAQASFGNLVFQTTSTERMRIDTSGNLLVGTTDSSATSGTGFKFKPAGGGSAGQARLDIVTSGSTAATSSYALYSTGASAFRFFVQDSGNINATSTSITAISDISLKENVRDLETGLTEIMALQPRRFDWKEETHLTEKNVAGFIAQEVEQVLPELVYDYQYNATEIKKSLKMGDILPTLVKAMQEQQALITQLQADVAALKENK